MNAIKGLLPWDAWVLIGMAVKTLVVFAAAFTMVPVMTWVERRGSAFIQWRLGPNRANLGPFSLQGLLQPIADGIKFLMKEEVVPDNANKLMFTVAPVLALIPAAMTFAVIPWGPAECRIWGTDLVFRGQVANIEGGVLYIFAIASMGVYGILCAGWSSNNKYALFGGMRASAQMISYELAMGLSVVGVFILAGSLDPMVIVEKQATIWFIIPSFIGGVIFMICVFAETNRLPFDLPEGESEIVAGYHVEYSSMKFALFFMSEYLNMVTAAALVATLFFGGWNLIPFVSWQMLGVDIEVLWFLPVLAFVAKWFFFLWLFVWVRWTLPRFRYDQLMSLGWKVMLPLAVVNLVVVVVIAGVYDTWLSGALKGYIGW